MNFDTVAQRIGDLPATFLRSGNVYQSWQMSQAFQLSEFTYGADALIPQLSFSSAYYGFLDVWGELLGIPRNPNEANSVYQNRITSTLESPVGSVYAIQAYSSMYFGTTVTVTESTSGVGYTINLPGRVSLSLIPQYLINLERIRPAGGPFSLIQSLESLFLNTFQYISSQYAGGSYLGGSSLSLASTIPEPITNSQPIIPTILLTDPILSSQLAV